MNLFHNNLKRLQRENDNTIAGIATAENKAEISRIIHYLSASSLPLFQIEIIRKDLAGMALEADQELVSLFQYMTIFYAIEFVILHSAPALWGISGPLVLSSIVYFFTVRRLGIFLRNKLSLHPNHLMRSLYILAAAIGLTAYACTTRIFFKDGSILLIHGNGWLILALFLLITIATAMVMNWHLNRCSKMYHYS